MLGKNIKKHLRAKIRDWANSIPEERSDVRDAILKDTLITGGAIVSLLQDEAPNDYDVYFRNMQSLKLVCDYYIERFINKCQKHEDENDENSPMVTTLPTIPELQRCYWVEHLYDGNSKGGWKPLKKDEKCPEDKEERLRIFIRSVGAVGINFDNYAETELDYRQALAKIGEAIKEANKDKKKKKEVLSYSPTFMTNNAISLTDKIQIVLRFYGEPEEIHKNYDFVHCSSYYLMKEDVLEMPSRALEAIINKELCYIGSKYPLCSLVRTRKFMKRGWTINAGQFVKMALQINDLDLKNFHVFEEQLVGVDSTYFSQLITVLETMKNNDPTFEPDSKYLIKLVNQIFDGEQDDANGTYAEEEDIPTNYVSEITENDSVVDEEEAENEDLRFEGDIVPDDEDNF